MSIERYFDYKECNSIKEIVYASAEKYADNIAFIVKHKDENKNVNYENITFKRLLEEINYLGTKFFNLGFKNKRIAVVGRNKYEWILSHLTNICGGILSIPLDKELQVDELESCLARSKADVVIFDEKYLENIEEIKNRNNTSLKEYICMNKIDNYKNIQDLKLEGKALYENGNREFVDTQIDENAMNILLFTSGTTSKSKAVMLSQKNIASNVSAMLQVEDIRSTDVNLAFLPFHHIFGSTEIIVMLAAGTATAFPDGLKYIAQNLKEYKVSLFVGVPLLVEAIYKNIEIGVKKKGKEKQVAFAKKISNILWKLHIDIRRKIFKDIINELGGALRLIISGGAPLDKKVAKGFNELGISLVQGYGLTETSPVISAENFKKVKYGSVGIPMENVKVEFDNKDENGIGEIIVKGPSVMLGYYENEEATSEIIKDGWLHTGDLGYQDKEGFIFITGRKKDMIVLKNGKKVFPEEVETIINRLDEVKECMIFGVSDQNDKNDVKLHVKIVYDKEFMEKQLNKINLDDIKEYIWNKIKEINKTFPPYKYIKGMILTEEELIKTTTKKIKRNEEMKNILETEQI